MLEELLDRRLSEPEAAEQGMKLPDKMRHLGIAIELLRLLRERQRVLEGQAARLADELGEESGQPRSGVMHGAMLSRATKS